jgi:hypothetical protein
MIVNIPCNTLFLQIHQVYIKTSRSLARVILSSCSPTSPPCTYCKLSILLLLVKFARTCGGEKSWRSKSSKLIWWLEELMKVIMKSFDKVSKKWTWNKKKSSWEAFDKLNIKWVNVTTIKALEKHLVSLRERVNGHINHDIHEAFNKLKKRGECDT